MASLKNIINNENNKNTIEFEGKKYRVPNTFHVNEDNITKDFYNNKGDYLRTDIITYTPILPISILENMENKSQKLELINLINRQRIVIEKKEAYNSSKIIKLADIGIHVNSNNSKYMVDFISNFVAINSEIIPIKKIAPKLGWTSDNFNSFIPFNMGEYVLDTNDSNITWINALSSKGRLEEWISYMKKFRDENYIFRFEMDASFATSLLKILNKRSFVVFNWADSKGGKTASVSAAMSVWGNPERLKVSFDATKNGIEGLAKLFSDLPIFIDEKQIENDQKKYDEVIYMFANGSSKLRGTQNGGIQQNSNWRSIALATGEEPLSTSKSQDGVRSRVIELYGKPINEEIDASSMYDFVERNYGTAGVVFINSLINIYSSNNFEKVKIYYDKLENKILENCKNLNFAQLSNITLVVLADILANNILFKENPQIALKKALDMAVFIADNITTSNKKDVIDLAKQNIEEWLLSNHSKFDERQIRKAYEEDETAKEYIKDNKITDKFGLYEEGIFYIWPSKFDDRIRSIGYNPDKIKKGFQDRGYISCDDDTNTKTIYHLGDNRKFIAYKLLVTTEVSKEVTEKIKQCEPITPKVELPEGMKLDDIYIPKN